MRKIVYLEDPRKLLETLGLDRKVDDLLKLSEYFDYAGGIFLPKNVFDESTARLPLIADFVKDLSNEKDGLVYLRSKKYYLNFVLDNDIKKLRKQLPSMIIETTDVLDGLKNVDIPDNLESKLVVGSILDHKKHYSLCMLNSVFYHMLKHDLDIDIYENVKDSCIKDVSNFYTFLLTGKIVEQGMFTSASLDAFEKQLILPTDTPKTPSNLEIIPAARKIIIREMDHPIQILLFAGQLLKCDKDTIVDFVVNPLNGAAEIGYAIKSIYSKLSIDKVKDIFLLKYSRYDENNIRDISLDPFVPKQLKNETGIICNKRLLILDDNIFKGETLYDIQRMCMSYSTSVDVAAVEKIMKFDETSLIKYDDLLIKPISKLRYIGNVLAEIKDNNLYNLIKE